MAAYQYKTIAELSRALVKKSKTGIFGPQSIETQAAQELINLDLSGPQKNLMAVIRGTLPFQSGYVTSNTISDLIGCSVASASVRLKVLHDKGYLKRADHGDETGGREFGYQVYYDAP